MNIKRIVPQLGVWFCQIENRAQSVYKMSKEKREKMKGIVKRWYLLAVSLVLILSAVGLSATEVLAAAPPTPPSGQFPSFGWYYFRI